ncbi:MAG: aminotransferase class IV, partial [Acidimicrobiia bacterium]|nr:aminotransferase class IV [Acidimicrobiia bacterium]
MPLVWVNGSLTDASAAAISVFDHGLVAGDGLFETVEIHEGRPFALTRHLRRMRRSAATLGFDPGISDDTLRQATDETIAANPESGLLRLTITPGRCPLGSTRDDGPSTVILATAPSRDWGESIDVSVVDWVRNERGALAGVKSTSYAENVMALARAHEAGASEALFANTLGNLCEGTGSNVFVELDGRLVT